MKVKRMPNGLTQLQWAVLWAIALGTLEVKLRSSYPRTRVVYVLGGEDVRGIVGLLQRRGLVRWRLVPSLFAVRPELTDEGRAML